MAEKNALPREFTAVVLAGGEGTRLVPLTCGQPKALLPVANKAMLWYPLRWLARAGFTRPLVVTVASSSDAIEAWAERECPEIGSAPTFFQVADDTDTAQVMRQVAAKVERSALIVSCDTITDIRLTSVLATHRERQATVTMVLKHCRPRDPKSKERHQVDYIGLEPDNRVVFFASSSELPDPAPLPQGFLASRPTMNLTRALSDGHIYVFSRFALAALCEKRHLSLNHEFLPMLVAEQFRRLKPDGTWGGLGIPPPEMTPLTDAGSARPAYCAADLGSGAVVSQTYDPLRVYAHIADNDGELAVDPTELKRLHVKAIADEEYLVRVNHISTYAEACRQLAASTSLQGSVVGENVQVGNGARISRCVLMDDVKIGEGCTLKNCIVGARSVVPKNSTLKDCVLGSDVTCLVEGAKCTGESYSREED